jgi:hypothetical protein
MTQTSTLWLQKSRINIAQEAAWSSRTTQGRGCKLSAGGSYGLEVAGARHHSVLGGQYLVVFLAVVTGVLVWYHQYAPAVVLTFFLVIKTGMDISTTLEDILQELRSRSASN